MPTTNEVTVLDGGMGTLLFRQGVPQSDKIWAATAIDDPQHHDTVVACHKMYINAGSEVITTNNYAIMPHYYAQYFGNDVYGRKIKEHTLLAAKLARRAVTESGKKVKVLGCLQPTRESLRPDLTENYLTDPWNYETSKTFYQTILKVMEPYVDGFLLETMNSMLELRCCLEAIRGLTKKPLSVSMQGSFFDPVTMEPVPYMCEHTARTLIEMKEIYNDNIVMFSLNCAPVKHITDSLSALSDRTKQDLDRLGISIGAYANGTELDAFVGVNFGVDSYSLESRPHDKEALQNYSKHARTWFNLGARCIGGCCHTGLPEIQQIAALKKQLLHENLSNSSRPRSKL